MPKKHRLRLYLEVPAFYGALLKGHDWTHEMNLKL